MAAGKVTLVIEQGSTWRRTIAWKDAAGTLIDTSTYTARMMVRAAIGDAAPVLSLTTANGMLAVGKLLEGTANESNVRITIPPAATDGLSDWGKGVYDLELVDALGEVTRILEGFVYLDMNVTR